MRRRVLAVVAGLAALAGAATSCGVPRQGKFAAIDPNNIPPALIETTTTSTVVETTTTVAEASTTTTIVPPVVTQEVTLYFVSGEQIAPYTDVLPEPLDPRQMLDALARGPAGAAATGLRSAIPSDSRFTTSKERGVLTVDVDQTFFDTLAVEDQRLAIAQIVLTLTTQIPAVGAVSFTLNGEPVSVLLATGESSAPGQPLYPEDYVTLLVTSPPATTSTTASAAPPEETTTVPG